MKYFNLKQHIILTATFANCYEKQKTELLKKLTNLIIPSWLEGGSFSKFIEKNLIEK